MIRCGSCGFPVREGKQFCPVCEGTSPNPDAILPDGTPLYFKTTTPHTFGSQQLELYNSLFGYRRAIDKED